MWSFAYVCVCFSVCLLVVASSQTWQKNAATTIVCVLTMCSVMCASVCVGGNCNDFCTHVERDGETEGDSGRERERERAGKAEHVIRKTTLISNLI